MRKLNCLLIDDEPYALELIESYAKKTPFLEIKGKFNSAIDAITFCQDEVIDLIYLDIQMPELNGLEFSRTIHKNTRIIFTTAFSEYAVESFKVNAIDYLLKPFNYEEFLNASGKALEWFRLIENNKSKSAEESDYIFVKSEYKQLKINLNEILYIEGLKDYVKIWLTNQTQPVLSLISLKKLEDELPVDKFMRVHRSFIVSLNKIQAIERGQILINKERITVADQYKDTFNKYLANKSL
jgi:DNA-binding LytR/AlgR family response regulator